MNNYNNAIIDRLPNHLRQYVVPQHYEHYTSVDHAVWRYVMRQNYSYLKDVAYYPYIPGLKKAGLSIEYIPDLQTMNDSLKQIGWGAVNVNGFIPSQAFMEFQAYRVLIIAADIRQLEHIEYTPAPDIIHESAGHAPIIGEPEYADYLQLTGEVGTKAMISKKDHELFEAIRKLAVLKELAGTDEKEIEAAEADLSIIQNNMGDPSEMALLARLHWWTVEYGLIGTPQDYKIYGAGLLSSIGESKSCMSPNVKKINYTIDALNYPYDITKPQPQLFVTPDFQNLINVLNEFSNTLVYKRGGKDGLKMAIDCGLLCTVTYSSGLQVSGVFIDGIRNDKISFIKTEGASALAFNDKQLDGHGKIFYKDGFISPVGKLKKYKKLLEDFSINELKEIGVETSKQATLEFEAGIIVKGVVENILIKNEKVLMISFSNANVKDNITGELLFKSESDIFNIAIGAEIVSVFSGAADKEAYEQVSVSLKEMPVSKYSTERETLHTLYQTVRDVRELKKETDCFVDIWNELKLNYKNDWLCALEILEILKDRNEQKIVQIEIETHLQKLKTTHSNLDKLIDDGLAALIKIDVIPAR